MAPDAVIVVTWSDDSGIEPTGRTVLRDGHHRPEMRSCLEAKAVIWSRSVTEWDSGKAFAKSIGGTCRSVTDTDDLFNQARALERASWSTKKDRPK